jgi:hypothetical protein
MKMIDRTLLKDLGFVSIEGYDHFVWHCTSPDFYVHFNDMPIAEGYSRQYVANGNLDAQDEFLKKFINRVRVEAIKEAAQRALDCTTNGVQVDWDIEDI